jgi:hypothetical protein
MREKYGLVDGPFPAPLPDVNGIDLKPDTSKITTIAELAKGLRELRMWAGNPSLRDLSSRCKYGMPSHSTFATLFKGEHLPTLDLVLICVAALGLEKDTQLWTSAWRRVAVGGGEVMGTWTAGYDRQGTRRHEKFRSRNEALDFLNREGDAKKLNPQYLSGPRVFLEDDELAEALLSREQELEEKAEWT